MQNRIKHWRMVRGMSQHQLADKVELSQSTISRLETGEIRLTLDMMEEMCGGSRCRTQSDL